MNVTIINDCKDENARGRQIARVQALFGGNVNFIGVKNDLEAGGNLIDILDAYGNSSGVILLNVAPRHKSFGKYENGTPFCYFWYKNTLIITTLEGVSLSFVKEFNLVDEIKVLGIPTVLPVLVKAGLIEESDIARITNTQFRSYEFVPLVAKYLFENKNVISESLDIFEVNDLPRTIWAVDNFGNCKTTIVVDQANKDFNIKINNEKLKNVQEYVRLKDVPKGEPGIVIGSSGLISKRFLEFVVQGNSAQKHFGVEIGDEV